MYVVFKPLRNRVKAAMGEIPELKRLSIDHSCLFTSFQKARKMIELKLVVLSSLSGLSSEKRR
jgi:hypothetical protein